MSISSGNNPALTADPVNLLVTVTNAGVGTPPEPILLKDGSNTIGTATLAANGTATFTTASMAAGTHSLVASYSGDTQNTNATSLAYSQTIQLRSSTTSRSALHSPPLHPVKLSRLSQSSKVSARPHRPVP